MGHLPKLAQFSSKLVLQILPSVSATVIGGYLLAQIHVGQQAEPPPPQIVIAPAAAPAATPAPEAPTAREERAAMRKVLKQRRENPEAPEVVRPAAPAQPAAPATTASVSPPAAMDSIAPNEPVERAAAPSRVKPAGAAPARRDAEATTDYVPAPPPGLPSATAAATNTPITPAPAAPVAVAPPAAPAPIVPPPVTAAQPVAPAPVAPAQAIMPAAPRVATTAAPPTAEAPPPSRGPVDAVFSTLSSVVGHAANATGNTVNWVIDLPGKAISAGGRIINGPSPPPPPAKLGDGEG